MGRSLSRALADYVVDWQREPWPIRWSAVFGRTAPLVLELGFGNGAFLVEQARAHPERDHVGIELSWTAATHLLRRLRAAQLGNARALLGEAEVLVRWPFALDSLSEVIVNHPCPWPKTRHYGRRLLTRGFLELLAERMRP
ncbi:MAG: tRNA (guanosine(46)-N7)-methyltransferase TrmB, partial [Planctomycetes bacterium]|nr:tRNA (guanosine(46)-N7)-methyltransferase TrmB [Planctomycetota bacterium]